MSADEKTEAEGWQEDAASNQRVFHYIRGSMSLCRKLGFYFHGVIPHKPGTPKRKDDCAACFRVLTREGKS